MKTYTLYFLLFILFFVGCSSTKEIATNIPDSLTTFSASGTLSVESPQMSGSASFELALRKPDSIKILAEGPFGISVGGVQIGNGKYTAYNALQNSVFQGNLSQGFSFGMFQFAISPDDAVNSLCGMRTFGRYTSEPDSFYATKDSYVFVFVSLNGRTKFFVNAISKRITRVRQFDIKNDLIVEEEYEYSLTDRNLWQVHTSHVSYFPKKTVITLSYDELSMNPTIDSLTISIPSDAQYQQLIQ
ncbi:MAG: hypothetical protein FD122_3790 [Stygiobacter sp.]|nr:MAG: hypothetical protein FD122_3790 [Stygiobacter sp.]